MIRKVCEVLTGNFLRQRLRRLDPFAELLFRRHIAGEPFLVAQKYEEGGGNNFESLFRDGRA